MSTNWADDAEDDTTTLDEALPEMQDRYESEVDENGIKTVIEYVKDVKTAETIKVTKKVKVIKKDENIKKSVVERRTWTKFGDAKDPPHTKKKLPDNYMTQYSGIGFSQDGVTYHPDAQQLSFEPKKKAQMKKKAVVADVKPIGVWKPGQRRANAEVGNISTQGAGGGNVSAMPGAVKTGAYVPPTLRAQDGTRRLDVDNIRQTRDDTATLRVSNLSDDTHEEDLQQLFRPFGPIQRTYLAKDKQTHLSRGFAFINFMRREDAARAMESLAGYGYDHLILQIEWAKPSLH
jgi:translation initiation factor 3 subunit G